MNIQNIAKIAGVSVATVSRVLNNKKDVSEKTKLKILKIIEEYDYKPNSLARNLVKNENNTIGVIIPDIKNLYFSNIINEIVNESNKKGLNVVLGCSNESFLLQKKYIDLFLEQRVKAIILIVTKNSNKNIEYFENLSKQVPLIFLDRKISGNFYGLYFENFNTTYNSIEKMIDKGAKKIGIITGPLELSTAYERYEAYKKALKDNGIKLEDKYIFNGDFSFESGYVLGKEIIKYDIDAIYISNNRMTLGFLKALKELEIDSKKYIISTFENNEITDFMESNISSNEIPFQEISKKCIKMIENIYNGLEIKNIIEIDLI